MKTWLIVLTLAAAQDPAPGDRVEITFRSDGTIVGTVVKSPADVLTIDLSPEYPGLSGTLTVPKRDIKSVRKVRATLVPRQETADPALPAPPKPSIATPEPPKPEVVAPVVADPKAEEELKKAKAFYAKFPAPDWSVERRNAIRLKRYRGQIPTPMEREFEEGFSLWEKGRAASR